MFSEATLTFVYQNLIGSQIPSRHPLDVTFKQDVQMYRST